MGHDVGMASRDTPALRGGTSSADHAVLILHGGGEHGTSATSPFQSAYVRMLDIYAGLKKQSTSTAIYLLRYRVRGWNPDQPVPDPVADAQWALEQIGQRHPGAPVALLGHSMGARTAFAVADHPAVVGVCGLAPWLPADEPLPQDLSRASFVIAHGTSDKMTSPPLSQAYAERLRAAGGRVARFEFAGAKHAMLNDPSLWRRFAVSTSLGLVGDGPLPPTVAKAFDDPTTRLSLPLESALGP